MACRGVHYALGEHQRAGLLSQFESTGKVIDFIQEEIEGAWDTEWLCETDKAWDAIHRCLTDGTLAETASTPRSWCVLNGRQLHTEDDYIVSFVEASDVKLVDQAIATFTESEFRSRYDAIDAGDYGVPLSEEDFRYTWGHFEELRELYARAAAAGRPVLFVVDQ